MDSSGLPESDLNAAIRAGRKNLLAARKSDGHWAYELEADVTIPAEYILLNHFLGEIDDEVEAKLASYIRRTQERNGGWPLYIGGDFNVSASVKAYFALKLAGDSPDDNHMRRAREAILAHGGAVNANVFTRLTLALFGQVPWSAAPVTRVEIMLFPRWFPLHINKVSYWTRTVTVPLLILTALRPMAKSPRGVSIDELFHTAPHRENYTLTNPTGHWMGNVMLRLDRIARKVEHLVPKFLTRKAIDKALKFVEERLNGDDGLGGIFPAMANALMVFDTLGYDKDDPRVVTARKAIDGLLTFNEEEGFCQPCLSPVWDTGLAAHAILESNAEGQDTAIASCDWLKERQILDVAGDWAVKRKGLRPGGWAFQYRNDRLLPGCGRHGRGGHGAAPPEPGQVQARHRPGGRMDRRHAVQERRLGRVRRGQRILFPGTYALRRSRRAAGSADGGRHGALHQHAGPGGLCEIPSGHYPGH